MSADNDAKIRRWEQYIEESRKEAKLLGPKGQRELQTVIHSYERLIAMARDEAAKPRAQPIREYLKDQTAFGPDAIKVMSDALERACHALNVNGHLCERQVIATRIIDLAQGGVTDAQALSERVVAEAKALEGSF